MLLFKTPGALLLAGICLGVCGTPVHLPGVQHNQDGDCFGECAKNQRSEHSGVQSGTGLLWKVGAGGGAGPHGPPTGESLVTQTENWDDHDGISGSTGAGGGVWNNRSEIRKVGIASQTRDSQRQSSSAPPLFPDHPVTPKKADVPTATFPLDGILAPPTILPQMNMTKRASRDQGDPKDKDHEADWADYHPSSIPPLDVVTPQNSAPVWDQYGPSVASLPDPLFPDIGANLMPKEDGPESVWTEATRASEGKRLCMCMCMCMCLVVINTLCLFEGVSENSRPYRSRTVITGFTEVTLKSEAEMRKVWRQRKKDVGFAAFPPL